mgnify:CR=1 FL=1
MKKMAGNIDDIDRKIESLLEELKKTKPSPFLAAKIEANIFNEDQRGRSKTYQLLFQKIAAGIMIITCSALGVLSVNSGTKNNGGGDDPQNEMIREIELIHFNEMKIESLENTLLEKRFEQ